MVHMHTHARAMSASASRGAAGDTEGCPLPDPVENASSTLPLTSYHIQRSCASDAIGKAGPGTFPLLGTASLSCAMRTVLRSPPHAWQSSEGEGRLERGFSMAASHSFQGELHPVVGERQIRSKTPSQLYLATCDRPKTPQPQCMMHRLQRAMRGECASPSGTLRVSCMCFNVHPEPRPKLHTTLRALCGITTRLELRVGRVRNGAHQVRSGDGVGSGRPSRAETDPRHVAT